jgi:uncharacterized RmlC-like cupin family protein
VRAVSPQLLPRRSVQLHFWTKAPLPSVDWPRGFWNALPMNAQNRHGSRILFSVVAHRISRMPDWKTNGVRVVRAGELDSNTPQTPGMTRAAAITHARTGANKLWAGTVVVEPAARTAAHHHGELETVLYIVKGRARMRWGDHLEFSDEAGPGDFIYVPPYVPHQEMNARTDEPVEAVVVRSGQQPIVINLDIAEATQKPAPFHP